MSVGASQDRDDRYDLYEQSAQAPEPLARFLDALATGRPEGGRTLGEDFSGTGAVARAWVALRTGNRAVCVDHDEQPLQRLRDRAGGALDSITIRCADVLRIDDPADVIAALNFSICEFHDRPRLVEYLRRARRRLNPGGVLVVDLYGGENAMTRGESDHELRPGPLGRVRYVWEQREADPLTGRVVNAMHFFPESGEAIRDAFVYDWRLWTVPELRDAMDEAGFASTEVHDRLGGAIDGDGAVLATPVTDPDELDDSFVVYVVGRTD